MATKIDPDTRNPDAGATGAGPAGYYSGTPLTVPGDFNYRQPVEEPPWWQFWAPRPEPYELNPVTSGGMERLRSQAQRMGLSQDQFNEIVARASEGDLDEEGLADYVDDLWRQSVGAMAQQRALKMAEETGPMLDKYEQSLNNDPLRRNPNYASQIREADTAINANIARTRLNASRGVADAGLRASGKVGDAVSAVEQEGAYQKGKYRSAAMEDIINKREQLPFMRRDLESEDIDRIMGVRDAIPGMDRFGRTTGTGFDLRSMNFGREDADFAKAMSILTTLVGAGQNATDSGMNFVSGLLPARG